MSSGELFMVGVIVIVTVLHIYGFYLILSANDIIEKMMDRRKQSIKPPSDA